MGLYDLTTIALCRAEGITTDMVGNARLGAIIELASAYIAKATGQWFRPRAFTADDPLKLDGSGGRILHLPAPVLTLDSVSDEGDAIAVSDLVVYNRQFGQYGDERLNPRIEWKAQAYVVTGLLMPTYSRAQATLWDKGAQNVWLAGTFGFLDGTWCGTWSNATAYSAEDTVTRSNQTYLALAASTGVDPATDDGSHWQVSAAPAAIRRCAIDLVLREYRLKTDPEYADSVARSRVTRETTDHHSYELGGLVASGGFTGDPNIDDVLAMYRRTYGGSSG